AGTNGGGVFKTTDGGGNWTAMNNGLTNPNVQTLAIDRIETDIIYAGTDFGSLFISLDGGANWSAIGGAISGADVLSLAIDPATTTTLYAGTAGEGLFFLTERGEPSGGSGGGGGGSCFIATAANGSPMARKFQPLSVIFILLALLCTTLFVLFRRLKLREVVFKTARLKSK
ncbi:MAG: hypothetical protein C0610_04215, partial [Desulfobacteraceae bacterium]